MKKNIYFHEKNLDTAIDRYADCTDIKQKKRVCQNVHILFFMHKTPTFSSQGFAIS